MKPAHWVGFLCDGNKLFSSLGGVIKFDSKKVFNL